MDYKSSELSLTCKLCSVLPETRQPFIAECVFLEQDRKPNVGKLIASVILTDEDILQLQDPEFLTQLTLDCSAILDIYKFLILRSWVCLNCIHRSTYSGYI